MVDFICKGFVKLGGTRNKRELQIQKCWPTSGFEPTILTYIGRQESYPVEYRPEGQIKTPFKGKCYIYMYLCYIIHVLL